MNVVERNTLVCDEQKTIRLRLLFTLSLKSSEKLSEIRTSLVERDCVTSWISESNEQKKET
jgi:hypothetical protein